MLYRARSRNVFTGTIFSHLRYPSAKGRKAVTLPWGDAATLMSIDGAKLVLKTARDHNTPPGIFMHIAETKTEGTYHAMPMWAYHDSNFGNDRASV